MKFINHKKIIKRILFFILTGLFLLSVIISCGYTSENNGNNGGNQTQTQDDAETFADSVPEEYFYPETDGGGADFTFLTPTTTWFFYTDVIRESISGEVLDDAIYMRNKYVEDKFNINFKEVSMDIGQIQNQLDKVIMAGEDVYDASFCPAYCGGYIGALITRNSFYNLEEIPALRLDQKWWNQTMRKEAAIGKGNKLYYAGCDINIMTLQCVSCVYFNHNMMNDLGLEPPYNAVRESEWTFDTLQRYMTAGARLNGADSFKWDANGTAIYGLTSYEDCATALLEGSRERFIVTDSDGTPRPAIEGERFINVLTKIQSMLQEQDGKYLYANDISSGFHCEPIFRNGRALMMLGELKAADVYRNMDDTFGIVPVPKYDENQENYYSHLMFQTPVLVIPVTNLRADFTGAVLDAMAYISNRDVTPVLFDISVSQKRLRNDESIDMLQIIKNSGSFDVGCAYGWTSAFYDSIRSEIGRGKKFEIVSQIEKNIEKINISIAKTMELFE